MIDRNCKRAIVKVTTDGDAIWWKQLTRLFTSAPMRLLIVESQLQS